jgi:3-hydroxyisobutyrate dehydrogenase-like beta-hydroxyacid dehydrogenase
MASPEDEKTRRESSAKDGVMTLPLAGYTIGLIGLGLMGRPMSRNLAKAGARLVVHSRSDGPVREMAAEGMTPAADPAGVIRSADVVILMLPDTAEVERVVLAPAGLLGAMAPGALVIDMGTTAVLATRRLAERIEAAGGDFVDAPVSGGAVGAKDATLTIMAGGRTAAFARAQPILAALGRRVTHVGEVGCGQVAKAANQVIVGLTINAVAEAFALARAAGADPARVREALQGGFADSRILELHGERMLTGQYAPGARVTTQIKDMRQAIELAASVGLSLPAVALGRARFEELGAKGDGDLDHSALYRLYDQSGDPR